MPAQLRYRPLTFHDLRHEPGRNRRIRVPGSTWLYRGTHQFGGASARSAWSLSDVKIVSPSVIQLVFTENHRRSTSGRHQGQDREIIWLSFKKEADQRSVAVFDFHSPPLLILRRTMSAIFTFLSSSTGKETVT